MDELQLGTKIREKSTGIIGEYSSRECKGAGESSVHGKFFVYKTVPPLGKSGRTEVDGVHSYEIGPKDRQPFEIVE